MEGGGKDESRKSEEMRGGRRSCAGPKGLIIQFSQRGGRGKKGMRRRERGEGGGSGGIGNKERKKRGRRG